MPAPRNLDQAAVVALLLDGHTCTAIARTFGCNRSSIKWIASRHRSAYPALRPKPRVRRPERDPSRTMPRFVRVPYEFRAAGLAEDYRDLVRDFGDVEGARQCRRLLDETRRLEALDARLGRAA